MTHYTEEDLLVIQQRMNPAPNAFSNDTPDPGLESNLVKKIRKFIKDNGLIGLCVPEHPMIRKILPPGWPD
ncbi:hypothetical protein ES703_89886 [subsurface metagenome]